MYPCVRWGVVSFASILFLCTAALGGEGLHLSDTAALQWVRSASVQPIFAPSLGVFLLSGKVNRSPFSGQVRRVRASVLANPVSVDKIWKENLAAVSKVEKGGKDLGCKRTGSGVFACERTGRSPAGEFVHEVVVFNRAKDVIHLRVDSRTSARHADDAFKNLRLEVK